MADVNQTLFDLSTTHQHDIERYKTGTYRKLLSYFLQMLEQFKDEIDRYSGKWTAKKKKRLLNNLDKIRGSAFSDMYDALVKEMKEFGGEESKTISRMIFQVMEKSGYKETVKYEDEDKVFNKIERQKIAMDDGTYRTFLGVFLTYKRRVKEILEETVKQEVDYNKTPAQIKTAITSKTSSFYSRGTTWLGATSGVLVQHSANVASQGVYKGNPRIVKGYVWNSVMDSSTTEICQYRNNRYWLYGHPEKSTLGGEYYAPAHFRCRSVNSPIIRSDTELGIENNNFKGQVPEKETYSQWFNKQPVSIQRDILGPARYDLWKSGEVKSITSFYTRDNRQLSLKQLQERGYKIPKQYIRYVG